MTSPAPACQIVEIESTLQCKYKGSRLGGYGIKNIEYPALGRFEELPAGARLTTPTTAAAATAPHHNARVSLVMGHAHRTLRSHLIARLPH